jgi:hypothetical protein
LSRPLEIIENYGGLWSLCPYTRSYLFCLQVITSLRERFPRGRIRASSIEQASSSARRGLAEGKRGRELQGLLLLSMFHSREAFHQKDRCSVGRAFWVSASDHPLAQAPPRHVTWKHASGRESKKTKTTTASNGRYEEDQTPERTT